MVTLGIFSVVPPTEPCALRSTQPLKVSTREFSWDKGGRCVWLTTYHPCSVETSRNSGALIYPEPLGPPRPVAGDKKKDTRLYQKRLSKCTLMKFWYFPSTFYKFIPWMWSYMPKHDARTVLLYSFWKLCVLCWLPVFFFIYFTRTEWKKVTI